MQVVLLRSLCFRLILLCFDSSPKNLPRLRCLLPLHYTMCTAQNSSTKPHCGAAGQTRPTDSSRNCAVPFDAEACACDKPGVGLCCVVFWPCNFGVLRSSRHLRCLVVQFRKRHRGCARLRPGDGPRQQRRNELWVRLVRGESSRRAGSGDRTPAIGSLVPDATVCS